MMKEMKKKERSRIGNYGRKEEMRMRRRRKKKTINKSQRKSLVLNLTHETHFITETSKRERKGEKECDKELRDSEREIGMGEKVGSKRDYKTNDAVDSNNVFLAISPSFPLPLSLLSSLLLSLLLS